MVAGDLIDQNAFGVLQSFRPFLGTRGNSYLMGLEGIMEILKGEHVQKVLDVFNFQGRGEEFQTMEAQWASGVSPFTLFLILILLLLADSPGGCDPLPDPPPGNA
jgi:hypothetical protein